MYTYELAAISRSGMWCEWKIFLFQFTCGPVEPHWRWLTSPTGFHWLIGLQNCRHRFPSTCVMCMQGRTHIFKIHARSMSVEKDIRYELLARLCPNSTGTHSQ